MKKKERDELIDLQKLLKKYLTKLEDDILKMPSNDVLDEEFNFFIKKAIYYRDVLNKIAKQLKENE
jgi:hypothetical protein